MNLTRAKYPFVSSGPNNIHTYPPIARKGPNGISASTPFLRNKIRHAPKKTPRIEPTNSVKNQTGGISPKHAPTAPMNFTSPQPKASFLNIFFPTIANIDNRKIETAIPENEFMSPSRRVVLFTDSGKKKENKREKTITKYVILSGMIRCFISIKKVNINRLVAMRYGMKTEKPAPSKMTRW